MFAQSLDLLSQADIFALIEFLDQQEDRLEVAATYGELVRHLYWKEKNVPDMVALARADIQYCLTAGTAVADEDVEQTLQQALAQMKRQMAHVEHGQMFIGQLGTAWQVFSATAQSPLR